MMIVVGEVKQVDETTHAAEEGMRFGAVVRLVVGIVQTEQGIRNCVSARQMGSRERGCHCRSVDEGKISEVGVGVSAIVWSEILEPASMNEKQEEHPIGVKIHLSSTD
jgi:hypothetical protein